MTTLSSLLDSRMLSFTQFRNCTSISNLNTKASCLHHRGHEILEMLDGVLYLFDCMLFDEMLVSFDQVLS